jgi:non-reducing end alpha-L-arabinofuranosidase
MADLEAGTWPGNSSLNVKNNPVDADLVTAMLKGEPNHMAIKGGDAQAGGLHSMYDGPRPSGYSPMKKQGEPVCVGPSLLFT